jgi:indole-3-glycerol phosphate synthase
MNTLETIMSERQADAESAKRRVPEVELLARSAGRVHHSLVDALAAGQGTHVIAEIKKASPSAGLLRPDYQPAAIARVYEAAGAVAISVLTEPRHFQGSDQHLRDVRAAVKLPVLRKDFVCDPYQIHEAAALGADVVLLIVAALDVRRLKTLYDVAVGYGLDVLVESHTADELRRALELEKAIIGVNSRNLKTLKTDLAVARELATLIPRDRLAIAESGIKTRADIEELERLGYRGFLIGESLLSAGDPATKLAGLVHSQSDVK